MRRRRGPYKKLTGEKRAEVGRRAAEHGVASSIWYSAGTLPEELKKKKKSSTDKVIIENFEALKAQFTDVKAVAEMNEIPHELIINWDQTGIHYVPVGSWTMEKEGAKRVEILGLDGKAPNYGGSLAGDYLPPQLIYKDTTKRCLPTIWH